MYTENTENRDFMYECTKQVKFDLKDLKYDKIFVHFGRNRSFFEQTGQKTSNCGVPNCKQQHFSLTSLSYFYMRITFFDRLKNTIEKFSENQKLYRNSYMSSYIYLFSKTHVRMYIHVRMYTYMYTYIYAYRMFLKSDKSMKTGFKT